MARRGSKVPEPRLIDNRNRVSLPRSVLRALGVGPGDFVTFIIGDQGSVSLHKLTMTVAPPARPAAEGQPLGGFAHRSANHLAG